jgi:quaternary ammonium compound-resistance protein SugE
MFQWDEYSGICGLRESHTAFTSRLLNGNDFSIHNGNLRMSWVYLFLAGLFEIGWPVGIKISQAAETRWLGIAIALSFMALSGYFLWLAQQSIPIGTAYAIWTGIGGVGTFIVGVLFFGDALSLMRILGVLLIVIGVATLKFSS